MDRSVAPHVSQNDQQQQQGHQQHGQMYPDGIAVQTQYRREQQQPYRQLMSWREDETAAPAQIPSHPAPVERQHLPLPVHRSSDSEWKPSREVRGTFQQGEFEELTLRGGRRFEHLYHVQGRHVARSDAASTTADHHSQPTAMRHKRQRDYGTWRPSRWQHGREPQLGALATSELTESRGETERNTALDFTMNLREQPRARFVLADDAHSSHLLINQRSRRRRLSPGITPRIELHRALYSPREGHEEDEEEKQSTFHESRDATVYSSTHDQGHRSRQTTPVCTVNTITASIAFVEMAHPPPTPPPRPQAVKRTTGRTSASVAAGKARARPRVRSVPSGNSQEKRRARECKINGCPNYIINKGLCFRHGGGKTCSEDDCTKSAKHAGKCWKHGGSVKCLVETCTRKGKSRGFCWAHGGGTKCSSDSCSKVAVSNGFCWAHGGGKRCAFEDCEKAAYKRTHNYCVDHYELLKDGNVTLEV